MATGCRPLALGSGAGHNPPCYNAPMTCRRLLLLAVPAVLVLIGVALWLANSKAAPHSPGIEPGMTYAEVLDAIGDRSMGVSASSTGINEVTCTTEEGIIRATFDDDGKRVARVTMDDWPEHTQQSPSLIERLRRWLRL